MRLIEKTVDLIFPKRCPVCHEITADRGDLVCRECRGRLTYVTDPYCIRCGKPFRESQKVLCKGCESKEIYFAKGRAVFVYDDVMRASIYRFKYGNRPEYAAYYAREMAEHLSDAINKWNPQVLIPIPVHKSKLKKRGYNQAYLIARELSNLTKIPVDNQLLIREKHTEKQKNLSSLDRAHNLKNAFKINTNGVQYLSAMLIDDIYTTGATMNSAAKVLKDGGTGEVYCLSVSIGYDV